ncbi:MAG TPA: hypothetical protein VJL82_09540 [Rhizomicrobium sp.]|nr:hypothetical protein [Rhizomicrobium sp.]
MKHLIRACLVSALMALPVAASAQSDVAPKAEAPKVAAGKMMACPMMGEMAAMQKDMDMMMGEVKGMMKDAKDTAQNEHLKKMHDHMAAMMVSMQKMSAMHGMMGSMMSGGMPGAPAPNNAAPAAPAPNNAAPVSPEDHRAHHPVP